jgi:tetratricopeptide (TPR) repeat protein
MQLAIKQPSASTLDLHQVGRRLISDKKPQEALEIFKLNFERHGDQWPVHVGLARGYAAVGDTKQALEHARKALAQAPDPVNRNSLQGMITEFEAGRNIAQ